MIGDAERSQRAILKIDSRARRSGSLPMITDLPADVREVGDEVVRRLRPRVKVVTTIGIRPTGTTE
jgi:hypothetical protein